MTANREILLFIVVSLHTKEKKIVRKVEKGRGEFSYILWKEINKGFGKATILAG